MPTLINQLRFAAARLVFNRGLIVALLLGTAIGAMLAFLTILAAYFQAQSGDTPTDDGGVALLNGPYVIPRAEGPGRGRAKRMSNALQALGDPTVVLGTPRKSAPAAATSAASNVTLNAARLNGSVNPHDLATTYQFNWGTTTGYGNTTPAKSAGSDRSDHKAFADISGLAPNTTYHFRIVATNAIGSRTGKDVTFTTTPGP